MSHDWIPTKEADMVIMMKAWAEGTLSTKKAAHFITLKKTKAARELLPGQLLFYGGGYSVPILNAVSR
jgi:hypothetical protein